LQGFIQSYKAGLKRVWKCGYVVVKNAVFLGMYRRIRDAIRVLVI
jgi:hypothetical protein